MLGGCRVSGVQRLAREAGARIGARLRRRGSRSAQHTAPPSPLPPLSLSVPPKGSLLHVAVDEAGGVDKVDGGERALERRGDLGEEVGLWMAAFVRLFAFS